MSLSPGRFDQRVTFQEKVASTDEYGSDDGGTWQNVATNPTVWARVRPLRGREFFQAGQAQSSAEVAITVRFRADVHERLRVLWNGAPHEIVAPPINVEGRGIDLELMCATGIRDGR